MPEWIAATVESGFNDPVSVFLTVLVTGYLLAPGGVTAGWATLLLAREVAASRKLPASWASVCPVAAICVVSRASSTTAQSAISNAKPPSHERSAVPGCS